MIHTLIEPLLDELDQTGWHEVIVVHRFGIIPNGRWIPHYDEYIPNAKGVCSQQVSLHAQEVASTCGEVECRFDAHFALDYIADRPGRHAHTRHRRVSNVDHIRACV